ncbi:hypothetical protein [Ketogulonicigenium robustum]|nr:hypothetical protein [Ketogulonicigenium robustum]
MTTPDLAHAHALAAAPDAAASVFAYVLEGATACAPSGLTTASVYDLTNMRIRRVYSDNADAYPV